MFKTTINAILFILGTFFNDYAQMLGLKFCAIVQEEGEDGLHYHDVSIKHVEEHPSPLKILPSSHESKTLIPSPQIY